MLDAWLLVPRKFRLRALIGHVALFAAVDAGHVLNATGRRSWSCARLIPLTLLRRPTPKLPLKPSFHYSKDGGLRVLVGSRGTQLRQQLVLFSDPVCLLLNISTVDFSFLRDGLKDASELLPINNMYIGPSARLLALFLQDLGVLECP